MISRLNCILKLIKQILNDIKSIKLKILLSLNFVLNIALCWISSFDSSITISISISQYVDSPIAIFICISLFLLFLYYLNNFISIILSAFLLKYMSNILDIKNIFINIWLNVKTLINNDIKPIVSNDINISNDIIPIVSNDINNDMFYYLMSAIFILGAIIIWYVALQSQQGVDNNLNNINLQEKVDYIENKLNNLPNVSKGANVEIENQIKILDSKNNNLQEKVDYLENKLNNLPKEENPIDIENQIKILDSKNNNLQEKVDYLENKLNNLPNVSANVEIENQIKILESNNVEIKENVLNLKTDFEIFKKESDVEIKENVLNLKTDFEIFKKESDLVNNDIENIIVQCNKTYELTTDNIAISESKNTLIESLQNNFSNLLKQTTASTSQMKKRVESLDIKMERLENMNPTKMKEAYITKIINREVHKRDNKLFANQETISTQQNVIMQNQELIDEKLSKLNIEAEDAAIENFINIKEYIQKIIQSNSLTELAITHLEEVLNNDAIPNKSITNK